MVLILSFRRRGQRLQRITRTAKNPVRVRRTIVVLMSDQGQSVRAITSLLQVSEDYVRDVIHAFNERGRTSSADWGHCGFSTW